MKKLFILLCTVLFIMAGCGNQHEASSSKKQMTIKNTYPIKAQNKSDKPGKMTTTTVKVPVNPKKVVVLDLGALDTLKQLKADGNIKGISKGIDESFLPDSLSKYKGKTYANIGNPGRPNYEKIAQINPDVIFIGFRQAYTKTLDEIKKAAPNAAIVYVSTDDDNYLKSIKENTLLLGKIFNKETDAKHLTQQLDNKATEVKKLAKVIHDKVMFLDIDEKGMKVYGDSGRFGGFLYKELGIKPADSSMKPTSKGHKVGFEYIVSKNPDKIFTINRVPSAGKKLHPNFSNSLIENVKAVKENQITQFDANSWYFAAGGIQTTIDQLNEVEKGLKH